MIRVLHNAPLPGKLKPQDLFFQDLFQDPFAMNSPSQRRRRPAPTAPGRSRQSARPSSRRPFLGLWLLCGFLYAVAGLLLASLGTPWIWALGAAGALLQGLALAGPKALQRFRWLTANLLVLLGILGSCTLVVALSIALNHLGSENLDDLSLSHAVMEVVLYSLIAVALGALCSLTTAALGDRLLRRHPGSKTSLILIATCLVGLAIGGGIGLAV